MELAVTFIIPTICAYPQLQSVTIQCDLQQYSLTRNNTVWPAGEPDQTHRIANPQDAPVIPGCATSICRRTSDALNHHKYSSEYTVAMLLSITQVFGFLFMLENILLNMGDLAMTKELLK